MYSTSSFYQNKSELVKNKSVLELGAGAGLPSLLCAKVILY
jgi:predicted nicotinamide N-methyase